MNNVSNMLKRHLQQIYTSLLIKSSRLYIHNILTHRMIFLPYDHNDIDMRILQKPWSWIWERERETERNNTKINNNSNLNIKKNWTCQMTILETSFMNNGYILCAKMNASVRCFALHITSRLAWGPFAVPTSEWWEQLL